MAALQGRTVVSKQHIRAPHHKGGHDEPDRPPRQRQPGGTAEPSLLKAVVTRHWSPNQAGCEDPIFPDLLRTQLNWQHQPTIGTLATLKKAWDQQCTALCSRTPTAGSATLSAHSVVSVHGQQHPGQFPVGPIFVLLGGIFAGTGMALVSLRESPLIRRGASRTMIICSDAISLGPPRLSPTNGRLESLIGFWRPEILCGRTAQPRQAS